MGGVKHGTVDVMAVRVGAVEDQEGNTLLGAGLHDIMQGGEVGVEAATHILQVEDDAFHILQLFRRRLLVLAV